MENTSRPLCGELAEGMSDGSYQKIATDRSRTANDAATWAKRRDASSYYYGFRESQSKMLGDGTAHVTPDYLPNPDSNSYINPT